MNLRSFDGDSAQELPAALKWRKELDGRDRVVQTADQTLDAAIRPDAPSGRQHVRKDGDVA